METATEHHEKTDVLGIISICLAFVGLPLIGFIFGIIGESKAKKEHRPVIISRIGWIVSLVITIVCIGIILLIFAAVPSLQKHARDIKRQNDLSMTAASLEGFYDKNGYYPGNLASLTDTVPTVDPNNIDYDYAPLPLGCTVCESFTLSTQLESGTKERYKLGSEHQSELIQP
jgi:Tfp pilus assembly protein PilE